MIDRQQIFTNAVRGIRAQGGPATSTDNPCRYRTETGRACAIGHNIADENYHPAIEGNFARDNNVLAAMGFDPYTIPVEDESFLLDLQKRLHDNIVMDHVDWSNPAPDADAVFMRAFEPAASAFADEFGLAVPE